MTDPPDSDYPPPDYPPADHPPAEPGPTSHRPAHQRAGSPPRWWTGRVPLLATIAVVAVLAIGAGTLTAWLLVRDADRDGPADPAVAVDAFLRAVYEEHDASQASALVCAEARDEAAMRTKIKGIEEYASAYEEPRFTWSAPELVEEHDQLAIMDVTVSMRTADEQLAEQALRVSVLDKEADGWWVCNIEDGPAAPPGGEPTDSGEPTDDSEPAEGDGNDR